MQESIINNSRNNSNSLGDLEARLSEARNKLNENSELARELYQDDVAEADSAYVDDVYNLFSSVSARVMSELDARNSMLEVGDSKKVSDAELVVKNNERWYKKLLKNVKRGKPVDSLSIKLKEDYETAEKIVKENQKRLDNKENVNKYELTIPVHIIAGNNCTLVNFPYVPGKNGFVKELGDVVIGACHGYGGQEIEPYRLKINESVDAETIKQMIMSEFDSSELRKAGIRLGTRTEKLNSDFNMKSTAEEGSESLQKLDDVVEKLPVSEEGTQKNLNECFYMPRKPNLNPRDMKKLENMILYCKSNDEISEEFDVERHVVNRWRSYNCNLSTYFIKEHLSDLNAVKNVNLTQRRSFNTRGKNHVRENMILGAVDIVKGDKNGDVKIKYLGLEGSNFGSYIDISQLCRINAHNSLVAENDIREYFAMRSTIKSYYLIKGGEIFKGLNHYYGDIGSALDFWKHKDKTFNLVNLDFMGPINGPKIKTIEKLFSQDRLEDNSVLYITLNNHPLCLSRLEKGSPSLGKEYCDGFGTKDQAKIVRDYISEFAKSNDYSYRGLTCDTYDGINGTQMLYMSFRINKMEG